MVGVRHMRAPWNTNNFLSKNSCGYDDIYLRILFFRKSTVRKPLALIISQILIVHYTIGYYMNLLADVDFGVIGFTFN